MKNKFKLIALSLSALFVAGLREQFSTANANDRGVSPGDKPKNEMVELLSKGAGVDPDDVYWRVAKGLSPKQAVDVAAQEKLELAIDAYAKTVKDKDDSEIRALAKKSGVDPVTLPDMSRQQLLIAIVKLDNSKAGFPAPGEEIPTSTSTKLAAPPSSEAPSSDVNVNLNTMTVPELKAHAAKNDVTLKDGMKKAQIIKAIDAKK